MKMRALLIVIFIFFGMSSFSFSQSGVGINTTNPRKTLEIAGDMKVGGHMKVNTIRNIDANDVTSFLIQDGSNFVKDVNTQVDGVALAYFQQYKLTNMSGDWVQGFNTNIDATKYVVVIVSAYFDKEQIMSGGTKAFFATPFVSARTTGDLWEIVADYPTSAPAGGGTGTWTIDTVILSRNFSKIIPTQTDDLNNKTTKAAGSAPIN